MTTTQPTSPAVSTGTAIAQIRVLRLANRGLKPKDVALEANARFGWTAVTGSYSLRGKRVEHSWNLLPDGSLIDCAADLVGGPSTVRVVTDERTLKRYRQTEQIAAPSEPRLVGLPEAAPRPASTVLDVLDPAPTDDDYTDYTDDTAAEPVFGGELQTHGYNPFDDEDNISVEPPLAETPKRRVIGADIDLDAIAPIEEEPAFLDPEFAVETPAINLDTLDGRVLKSQREVPEWIAELDASDPEPAFPAPADRFLPPAPFDPAPSEIETEIPHEPFVFDPAPVGDRIDDSEEPMSEEHLDSAAAADEDPAWIPPSNGADFSNWSADETEPAAVETLAPRETEQGGAVTADTGALSDLLGLFGDHSGDIDVASIDLQPRRRSRRAVPLQVPADGTDPSEADATPDAGAETPQRTGRSLRLPALPGRPATENDLNEAAETPRNNRQLITIAAAGAAVLLLVMIPVLGQLTGKFVFVPIKSGSMAPALKSGDLAIGSKTGFTGVKNRDVIVFDDTTGFGTRVINRAIRVTPSEIHTKGDAEAKEAPIPINPLPTRDIIKINHKIPLLGHLYAFVTGKMGRLVIAMIVGTGVIFAVIGRGSRKPKIA